MASVIDMRSDTVTLPPPAMRDAMHQAELGDDVYGEDPTVNALEARGAALLGKPAGLFVPTGAMGNLLAVLAHCRRGDEVVVGDRSHMYLNEAGAPSVLGGTTARSVPTAASGELAPADIEAVVRPTNIHFPRSGLVCLENTHNFAGGRVLDAAYMRRVRAVTDAAKLPVHLDGARLFNAAIALGVPAADLTADVDSVSVCFSKGLAAPVGSLLVGAPAFIAEARRWRKQLGGGMRQAGVLAAACLYGLDHMIERLADDHAHARQLAAGLAELLPGSADPATVQTNIVMWDVKALPGRAAGVLERLAADGLRASSIGPATVRFVTHWGVTAADIDASLARIARHV